MTPNLTLNYGLRWDLQTPFKARNNNLTAVSLESVCGMSGLGSGGTYDKCKFFSAGTNTGAVPQYVQLTKGVNGYNVDWNNFAPNIGAAWKPNVQDGFLRTILGDPEQATLRGGYSMTFGLERMARFADFYDDNPGGELNANRNYTTGFPIGAAPLLLRDTSRLGPPAFNDAPTYPLAAVAANSINIFDPNIRTPYVHQYSFGFQRSLGRDMAFEVRYVGNRNKNAWGIENWNVEENIYENGFLDEFKRAQQNLLANVAAGRGGTFAYFWPGTGTAPLPTYLAYFSGTGASQANNPQAYSSTNFSNSAWTGHLGQYEPDPMDAANDLHANTTFRSNAINAGLPANFFVLNPAVTSANVMRSVGGTRYNSVQLEVRRRFSQGLLIQANYTWSNRENLTLQIPGTTPLGYHFDRAYFNNTDVPHAFKTQWAWQIPVGRDRRFGAGMGSVLNAILGNWEFSGTGRLQRQQFDLGSVRLVGMSKSDLQKVFSIRTVQGDDGTTTVYNFPQDITDNTRRAYNSDPTSANGYSGDGPPTGRYIAPASTPGCVAINAGDCGAPRQVLLLGPLFSRWDMRINKRFPFGGKTSFDFGLEVLNVFDNINYNFQTNPNPGTSANTFRVTTAYTDINTTFDPGGRIGQLVLRFNW